jgi:hypothetical protein
MNGSIALHAIGTVEHPRVHHPLTVSLPGRVPLHGRHWQRQPREVSNLNSGYEGDTVSSKSVTAVLFVRGQFKIRDARQTLQSNG